MNPFQCQDLVFEPIVARQFATGEGIAKLLQNNSLSNRQKAQRPQSVVDGHDGHASRYQISHSARGGKHVCSVHLIRSAVQPYEDGESFSRGGLKHA